MKRFYFINNVVKAEGFQRWYIEAETLKDAKDKRGRGEKAIFDSEDVEVVRIGEDEWEEDFE